MSKHARLAVYVLSALLLPVAARAGYDFSISHSWTDPHVNTSPTNIGLDSLFLWVTCAEQGMSAFDAEVSGDVPVIAFLPHQGVFNVGSPSSLLLSFTSCVSGDSVNMVLGAILVWDSTATGGRVYLDASSANEEMIVASCDSTGHVYPYIPRAVGFRSDGGSPDTTGSPYGCGVFPDRIASRPVGTIGEWSDAYGAPPSGLGTDGPVMVMRRMSSEGNRGAFIVGGSFTEAGSVGNLPGFAKFQGRQEQVQGIWQWPWGTRPTVGPVTVLAAGEAVTREVAIGGEGGPFLYYDGDEWTSDIPYYQGDDPVIYGIEHWDINDKFLVVGDWNGGTPNDDFSRLAQFNPDLPGPNFRFEAFGYPEVGDTVYTVQDHVGPERIAAIIELECPPPSDPCDFATSVEHFVLVGGQFSYVDGVSPTGGDVSFYTNNVAYLDTSGRMYPFGSLGAGGLPGPTYDFEIHVDETVEQSHVYAAGEYGEIEPGLEQPPVWELELPAAGTEFQEPWLPLPGGGGPFKVGPNNSAVIHNLSFQAEKEGEITKLYLYAIGDFDGVLTQDPGGFAEEARGFARYSMTDRVWRSLGAEALTDGVGRAGGRLTHSVAVGGFFTQVDDGNVESNYFGQFNPPFFPTSAPEEMAGAGVPISLEIASANPTRGEADVYYVVPRTMHVRIDIYDVRGSRVRTLVNENQYAGEHVVRWDGTTTSGTPVGSGVYFVRFDGQHDALAKKITVVR